MYIGNTTISGGEEETPGSPEKCVKVTLSVVQSDVTEYPGKELDDTREVLVSELRGVGVVIEPRPVESPRVTLKCFV